jgi:error-prone DNA polymerase
VFQEQAIKVAVVAAGFAPGEADELRRSMTHKRSTERLAKLHGRLLEGMAARGIGREDAEEIVSQLSGFAGYGFPESHSASFALLVYASAWLKRHHHAAFSCALLNSLPMGFYAAHTIVDDAKRHGVDVRGLDVTASRWDCTLESGDARAPSSRALPHVATSREAWGSHLAIRVGYRFVRGLSAKHQATLEATAPYSSWDDMVERACLPREAMARIAAADGFRSLGIPRREALWMALRMPPTGEEIFSDGGHGETKGQIEFDGLTPRESVLADYDSLGLSADTHPCAFFRASFTRSRVLSSRDLRAKKNKQRVRVGGMSIVRQRPPTAGNVVFVTLEDELGFTNLVIPPEVWQAYRPLARDALFVIAEGVVQRAGAAINVQVESFEPAMPDDENHDRPKSADLEPKVRSRDFR